MSENFRDYLIALRDDDVLRQSYQQDPWKTLADARISKEEKEALRSAELSKIREALGDQDLPEGIADLVARLGPVS